MNKKDNFNFHEEYKLDNLTMKTLKEMIGIGIWKELPHVIITPYTVIDLFTLRSEQCFPFLIFAKHALSLAKFINDPSKNICPYPLCLLVDGPPGSGKSIVVLAMLFFIFHLGLICVCRGSAQTAKAAANISIFNIKFVTNHKLYALRCQNKRNNSGSYSTKKKNSKDYMKATHGNAIYYFLDEYSLVPQSQFGLMLEQMEYVRNSNPYNEEFAGRSMISSGDLNQLKLGTPMYSTIDGEENFMDNNSITYDENTKNTTKKELPIDRSKILKIRAKSFWMTFKVYQLKEVSRFKDSPGGRKIARIIGHLRMGILTEEDIEDLNNRYVDDPINSIDLNSPIWQDLIMINPRNDLLTVAAPMLAIAAGLSRNKTVYVWKTLEVYTGTSIHLTGKDYILAGNVNFRKANSFRTEVYFDGIEYLFNSTEASTLGWINQGQCSGVKIEFNKNEPPMITKSTPKSVIHLHYQPEAIHVVPESKSISETKELKIMRDETHFKVFTGKEASFSVTRIGFIHLWYSQVRTDFNVQCTTIKDPQKVLMDLVQPVTGTIKNESLLVTLSRVQDIEQIGILRQLYKKSSKGSKETYLKNINKIIKLSKEKIIELKRIEQESKKLESNYPTLFNISNKVGHDKKNNTYTSMTISEYDKLQESKLVKELINNKRKRKSKILNFKKNDTNDTCTSRSKIN